MLGEAPDLPGPEMGHALGGHIEIIFLRDGLSTATGVGGNKPNMGVPPSQVQLPDLILAGIAWQRVDYNQ